MDEYTHHIVDCNRVYYINIPARQDLSLYTSVKRNIIKEIDIEFI